MSKKRAVIFDIGGVLLHLGTPQYLADLQAALGASHAAFDRHYRRYAHQLERGEVQEAELWMHITGRPVPEDTFDHLFERHFPPIPEMLQFARSLRAEGVLTAILSNTIPSHVRVMRRMGFLDEFSPVVLSCEIGSRKPEPESIGRVMELIGLPPERIAYIDDVPEYVEMGRAAGVHAFLHRGNPGETQQAVRDWLKG